MTQTCDVLDSDDEELQKKDDGYESYCVDVKGVNAIDTEDPHDYVYKNLPKKHHVLKKVADCKYCEAIRFQYEPPRFYCRQGKITVATPLVPLSWYDYSQDMLIMMRSTLQNISGTSNHISHSQVLE